MALGWLSFLGFGGSPQGASGYLIISTLEIQPILMVDALAIQPILLGEITVCPVPDSEMAYVA